MTAADTGDLGVPLDEKLARALLDKCEEKGITIKNAPAFAATLTIVLDCFEEHLPVPQLDAFHTATEAALTCMMEMQGLLPRFRAAMETCRRELASLDGLAYGYLADKAAPGDEAAGDDYLQSLLEEARLSVQELDEVGKFGAPIAGWINSAIPPLERLKSLSSRQLKRGRGRPNNSPRVYHAVWVLCEFWWEDQGSKPYAEYNAEYGVSEPSNAAAIFIDLVMRAILERRFPEPRERPLSQIRTELERVVRKLPKVKNRTVSC